VAAGAPDLVERVPQGLSQVDPVPPCPGGGVDGVLVVAEHERRRHPLDVEQPVGRLGDGVPVREVTDTADEGPVPALAVVDRGPDGV
jgi:hypothetical protein